MVVAPTIVHIDAHTPSLRFPGGFGSIRPDRCAKAVSTKMLYYIDVNVDRINKDSDSDSDSVGRRCCRLATSRRNTSY